MQRAQVGHRSGIARACVTGSGVPGGVQGVPRLVNDVRISKLGVPVDDPLVLDDPFGGAGVDLAHRGESCQYYSRSGEVPIKYTSSAAVDRTW